MLRLIKNTKHKLLSRIFAIISVIVLILSLSINTFAETPALYSSGVSTEPYHSFSGHPFTFNTYLSSGDYFTSSVSPYCTYNGYTFASSSSDSIVYEGVNSDFYYYNLASDMYIEMELGAINNIFPTGYFAAYMSLLSSVDGPSSDPVSYYTIEARDYYYYITPSFGSFSDEYSYFEFLFRTDDYEFSFDSDPTFEMYYTLGGVPDTADNLEYYSGDAIDGNGILGFCPSVDLILSLLEDNPDGFLIYIDYACLTLPVSDNSIYLDGIYRSDFYYYRSADLELYEEPISPMNPGVFRDYTSWIGTAVGGFLDLQFVDGFTIGGILMTLIAFMLTMWFLKVFAGG